MREKPIVAYSGGQRDVRNQVDNSGTGRDSPRFGNCPIDVLRCLKNTSGCWPTCGLISAATLTVQQFKNDPYYHRFIVPILKGREMGGKKFCWLAHYLNLPDDAVVQVYPKDGVHIVVVGGEANAMMQGWQMWNS